MVTTTLNDLQSLTILIGEKDLSTVKSILNFLKERYPQFAIMKFRTGKIGEDILVSFKVSSEFYPKVLEKFAYNNIPLIMKDKNIIAYVDEKKEEKKRKLRAQGWSEITKSKRQLSLHELVKISEQGKVIEVLNEAKGGISSNIKIVEKAKELLSITIKTAIEKLVNFSEENISKRQYAIDQLIKIATDSDLKLFHKHEEINEAGMFAIQISLTHHNYYKNLIDLANNSRLNNILNIKSAIALAELFLNDQDLNEELPDVIKEINIRWLKIAHETVLNKLSEEESQKFHNFIEFIEEGRKTN